MFRTEVRRDGLIGIVQLLAQASAVGTNKTGLAVDIDVIFSGPFPDFWAEYEQYLERIHNFEKEVFFGLLTPETLTHHEPEY